MDQYNIATALLKCPKSAGNRVIPLFSARNDLCYLAETVMLHDLCPAIIDLIRSRYQYDLIYLTVFKRCQRII